MRAHLASPRSLVTLGTAAVLGCALAVSGCGGNTSSREFNSLPATPAPSAAAPPVVVAEPAPAPARPAAKAPVPAAAPDSSAALARSRKAERRALHQRRMASHALRLERRAALRAHRRAKARERRLRDELAAARIAAPRPARSHPHRPARTPIHASDVPTADSQRAARVVVVRFHDLLNTHDGAACDLLSPRFLADHFAGDDTGAQLAGCRSGVESLTSAVSVLVQGGGSEPGGEWVKVVSRFGDQERPQVMHLIRSGHDWLIDRVEPVSAR